MFEFSIDGKVTLLMLDNIFSILQYNNFIDILKKLSNICTLDFSSKSIQKKIDCPIDNDYFYNLSYKLVYISRLQLLNLDSKLLTNLKDTRITDIKTSSSISHMTYIPLLKILSMNGKRILK